MPASVDDQVLDFYNKLFDHLFSEPFRANISVRRRLNEVIRQVEAVADAASSSLTRFFQSQRLSAVTVECILAGFSTIGELLFLDNIANPNVATEEIVENLLDHLPCPQAIQKRHIPIYRLALYTVVQVLMQVGPVMAEWQKLNFSSTFELPRRVVNRLNEISDQINALGPSGQTGADERYELQYRDYLLQRFHKVEAGTVRMTTSLDVDLRELFVMPRMVQRKSAQDENAAKTDASVHLMDLAAARQLYGDQDRYDRFLLADEDNETTTELPPAALEQVKSFSRMVMIGLPGAGKSTFFEWLQVKLASVEEKFILGDQQAIPLMLRVRQLNLRNLPEGSALIEKATASKDRADLMPKGWIDRQMSAGRVLFMLDGLDETEPDLLKQYLLPWLFELLKKYPKCHYLISSRPVGYPPGLLHTSKFVECDLLDFDNSQIQDYTCHWCTSVRLARNELEAEARCEGEVDGEKIVKGFQEHPYIRHLARNPLMLSAICLVNYFEGGRLPEDRALLYRLCVEGLLHNWDQRRGIHSDFGFDEKLRACREIALLMQSEDRAECEAEWVKDVFTRVLGDLDRATKLLEHIRYRTGLLLERRASVFGFAHLTFQEYLAAQAIHEGNQVGIDTNQLVQEHNDGRWKEVTALYCGLATTPAVQNLIEQLIDQTDTESLAEVLTEAYLSTESRLARNRELRQKILKRVALSPGSFSLIGSESLSRFPADEVGLIANMLVGNIQSCIRASQSYWWLLKNPDYIDMNYLVNQLKEWKKLHPNQIAELFYLIHEFAEDQMLEEIEKEIFSLEGPNFYHNESYSSQSEIALMALNHRNLNQSNLKGFKDSFVQIIKTFLDSESLYLENLRLLPDLLTKIMSNTSTSFWKLDKREDFTSIAKQLSNHLKSVTSQRTLEDNFPLFEEPYNILITEEFYGISITSFLRLDEDERGKLVKHLSAHSKQKAIEARESAIEALDNWADWLENESLQKNPVN
jgi:NACHT domain